MCAPFISHIPPPFSRSRNQGGRPFTPKALYQVSVASTGRPTSPDSMIWRALTLGAMNSSVWAVKSLTPCRRAAAIIWSHSSTVSAIGFSMMTCFPASAAAIATGQCRKWGRVRATICTSSRARRSR